MLEPLALTTAAELPPALAAELPAALHDRVFWVARADSPVVGALFEAVPEPPLDAALVEAGVAFSSLLSRALAESPGFLSAIGATAPAGQTVSVSLGFHTGDGAVVRAFFEQHAAPIGARGRIDALRLARVRAGGVAVEAVIATAPPTPGRALGRGWFSLPAGAETLRCAGGSGRLSDAPIQTFDFPRSPPPPDPLTEDAALRRVNHHLAWRPVTWDEEWARVFAQSGQVTIVNGRHHAAHRWTVRARARWLPDGPVSVARFDAWVQANRAAWQAAAFADRGSELLLDPTLLRAPSLQTAADFASVVLDLAATAATLAPIEVPSRLPAAAALSAAELARIWRWLPEVAARYNLPPSRSHLHKMPDAVVEAAALCWMAGAPGFDHPYDPELEAKGLVQLRKRLGRERMQALITRHRGGQAPASGERPG